MNKFKAVFLDSLLEIRSRKIIYIYGIVTVFLVLVFALIPSFQIQGENLFEGDIISDSLMGRILSHFFDGFIGFAIFLMVFGSAFLVPSYLGKGRIELTLSKPISRWNLLTMKFISIYLIHIVILLLMTFLLWLTISIRLSSFDWLILLGTLFSFVHFLFIYSFVFAVGVPTCWNRANIFMNFWVRRSGRRSSIGCTTSSLNSARSARILYRS